MTQLDVPNISFTHYLDLLKRRTWHVIIVSVLGLIVGGVVAMLIPRYYVATTTVELKRPILDPEDGTPKDLMSQVIKSAEYTVPRGIPQAVRELGWTEGVTGSMNDRRAFLKAIEGRVRVHDMGPRNEGRRRAILMISYRDERGDRSAAMTNKLRVIWLKEFLEGLKKDAKREIDDVVRRLTSMKKERRSAAQELQVYEEDNKINPADYKGLRGDSAVSSLLTKEIGQRNAEIQTLELRIKSLDRMIGTRNKELDGMSETVKIDIDEMMTNPAMRKEYDKQVMTVLYSTIRLANLKPAHDEYNSTKRTLEMARSRLDELQKLAGGQAAEKPNPKYEKLDREIRELKAEKVDKEEEVAGLEAFLAQLETRLAKLPKINLNYRILLDKLAALTAQEKGLNAEVISKTRALDSMQTNRPYGELVDAHIPPAPTEPNPYALAAMGCLVGLALAIALVLLIDFLQMSFKSVADVESGLGLPVLGTMTYLETDEELSSTRGRRTRLTVFAVTFLVLLLTVVTIYYINPTLLPQPVIDTLDVILGKPK